jgi:hypothetical protein
VKELVLMGGRSRVEGQLPATGGVLPIRLAFGYNRFARGLEFLIIICRYEARQSRKVAQLNCPSGQQMNSNLIVDHP